MAVIDFSGKYFVYQSFRVDQSVPVVVVFDYLVYCDIEELDFERNRAVLFPN